MPQAPTELISVVMPVHNALPHLDKAIEGMIEADKIAPPLSESKCPLISK